MRIAKKAQQHSCLIVIFISSMSAISAERINQEGRILGPAPSISSSILFNTSAADAVVSAMQIFPPTNAWNEDVSQLPLLTTNSTSAKMIAKIISDLTPSGNTTLRMFYEMNYILVPDNEPKVDIFFFNYPDQSDDLKPGSTTTGSYPFDPNTPVETWPVGTGTLSNAQWQQNINNDKGDRHSIVVMPGAGFTWETWETQFYPNKSPQWQASNGAKFDLNSNTLRPAGYTSGDAAGLSMFSGIVRYDECERGMVEHAVRIVVAASRQAYIYPATHQAGSTTDFNTPAMGQRLRLNGNFQIPTNWSKEEKAVALGLKKYGAIVADNGNYFSISVAPDDRFPAGCFDNISKLAITNFEVVESTGASGGPRAPNPPVVIAGGDQTVSLTSVATLTGSVTGGIAPVTTQWYVYPYSTPPGKVTFTTPTSTNATATFSAVGTYTLMLSASDATHGKVYDAVNITVTADGNNPVPVLTSISPTGVVAGSAALSLTLNGPNFIPASTVKWSGQNDLIPVSVSATQITVKVPATYLATAGTASVIVSNPGPGGGLSTPATFTINGVPQNQPPTVASGPAANPSTVTGATCQLSVIGADDAPESQLIYQWGTVGTSPAAVSFSVNANNAAKNTTVTFTAAGTYQFQVKIQDVGSLSITSNPITVTVSQTLTSLSILPATVSIVTGSPLQFGAKALDQFNGVIDSPALTWSADAGAGTISAVGLLAAAGTAGGPFNVTVASGGISAVARVTLTAVAPPGSGTFTSGPAAVNTAGAIGSPSQFSATPTGTGPFTFVWNFGDGTTDTSGGTVSHVYTTPGNYTITVTAVDSQGNVTTGTTTFTVAGSAGSGGGTPGGGSPGGGGTAGKITMTVNKFQGTLKTKTPGHDGCTLSGIIPNLPPLFTTTGQTLTLSVSGVAVSFTLDAHGRGKSKAGSVMVILKPSQRNKTTKTLDFLGGAVNFKAVLLNGNWATAWGIPATTQKNMPLPLTVDLTMNGITYEAVITAKYTGAPGKTGMVKK